MSPTNLDYVKRNISDSSVTINDRLLIINILINELRALFKEDRDFLPEEMEIFKQLLSYTEEIKKLFGDEKVFNLKEGKSLNQAKQDLLDKLNSSANKTKPLFKKEDEPKYIAANKYLNYLIRSIENISGKDMNVLELIAKPSQDQLELKLFANEPEEGFIQQSKYFTDTFDKFISEIQAKNEEFKRKWGGIVKAGNDSLQVSLNYKEGTTELEIKRQVDQLLRIIRNPKHKLYYLALWKYAALKNNRLFKGVRVSDIIKIAKPGKTIQYKDKLEFTEFIEAYSMLKIEQTISTKVKKGKRYDAKIEDVKSINLFNVTHRRYVTKLDKQGNEINARTIYKIYGELPKDPYNVGYHIPETIFNLDGNSGERIAFFLELYRLKNQRFNYPEAPVRKTRFDLMRLAALEKTDANNKTEANKLLLETLKLGYDLKIIKSYPHKLPLDDNEIIEIYLFFPQIKQLEEQNSSTNLAKQFN